MSLPVRMSRGILSMAGLLAFGLSSRGQDQPVLPKGHPEPDKTTPSISLTEYQTRLDDLQQLVITCRQAMSPAACPGDKVGPDLVLSLPSGPRQVRFGWLRSLLDQAAHPNATPEPSSPAPAAPVLNKPAPPKAPTAARPTPQQRQTAPGSNPAIPSPEDVIGIAGTPNIFKQLESARRRLVQDQAWARSASQPRSASQLESQSPTITASKQVSAHQALTAILAAKEYHAATAQKSIKDRILEKIANWIDTTIGELIKAGSKSRWFGLAAEIAFVVALSVALVWLLIHLERQARLGSALIRPDGGIGAASTRDWRLWAEDARQAAAQGAWRNAIHFLYWSSISRLESSGLWPADRARTPREYLALLAPDSSQHLNLNALTRSFERTWYAGRPAIESDYRAAETIADQIAIHSSTSRKGAVS